MNNSKIAERITRELDIRPGQTEAVMALIEEGNTIPFIARYRKEVTGGMSDELLRSFDDRLKSLHNLEERKETVLAAIEEQGKLTDELKLKIENAETMVQVEDLYRPYKKARKTRADMAREKGLEPFSLYMLLPGGKKPVLEEAEKYVTGSKEDGEGHLVDEVGNLLVDKEGNPLKAELAVPDVAAAIAGAQDIIAGTVSDDADFREYIRHRTFQYGNMVCGLAAAGKKAVGDGERTVYENYYEFSEPIKKLPGHRILAINRGEKEKILTVGIDAPVEDILGYLIGKMASRCTADAKPYVAAAVEDSYKRLMAPSIETDIRNELTEKAQEGAIGVFGSNLEQLLMQPPLAGKTVLGWDPAFRTGCKLAVCDSTGKILETTVVYPTAPQNKVAETEKVLTRLVEQYGVDVISVGNGTASRESEKIIADFIAGRAAADNKKDKAINTKEVGPGKGAGAGSGKPLQYVIVNEAGASVYSASKLATEEYPDLDVGERSSASIARRLQDPLAELVKIDPKAIGVGQYQHDMDQKKLGEALGAVVEDCVNKVGVDLNTASPSLLEYVAGITKVTAANIVKFREDKGRFNNRRELLKVPKLGPKAFEQCAGFLRINGGDEPLDASAVHPESYEAARKILAGATAEQAGVGKFTYKDIKAELEKPGRDPREEGEAPILRSDVLEMKDLREGMELKGTVRNIVDFGAFVDIGVHQDGLVHISQMADRYIKHPLDVVKVGDIVHVRVLAVDEKRGKISLTMRKNS